MRRTFSWGRVPGSRTRRFALLAVGCAAALARADSMPGQSLEGRVVRPTGEPVPGVPIELHRITSTAGSVADSGRSAAAGAFRFDVEDTPERAIYLVAAEHQGVTYFGPPLHLPLDGQRGYEVIVYDTVAVSVRPTGTRVGMRHVVVTPSAGGLDVAEVYDIVGAEDRTLVPSEGVALWASALPDGAASVRPVDDGLAPASVEVTSDSVRFSGVLSPAGMRIGYAYRIPGEVLRLGVQHPTDRVEIVVAGFPASVEGAVHAETGIRGQQAFERYEATSLDSGDELRVRWLVPGGFDRWVVIWLAGGVLLLAAAATLWFVDRGGVALRG